MVDLKNDPAYNDDSQPSVTSSAEALAAADEMAGVPPAAAVVSVPADVLDMEARRAKAEEAVEEAPKAEAAEDFGTGNYEDRTVAQLRALAESKGLPTSGTKEDLIERLRA